MSSHGGKKSHVQHPLDRQSSWLGLTLDEVEKQLGDLGKPLSTMNVDELLKNVLTAEALHSSRIDRGSTSAAASLQREASMSLARAFTGKRVDEVWSNIQQCHKMRNSEEDMSNQERGPSLGETTLEDFLVQAGMCVADASLGTAMSLDSALNFQDFSPQIKLSHSASMDRLPDTPVSDRKDSGNLEKAFERRLRRKIKNRESAARSRARKQAYHNELVSKVTRLEEEILMLKKEKEFEKTMSCEFPEPRYQLRRTSSC